MAWPNVYGLDVSKLRAHSTPPPPRKPAILLVHSYFLTPTHLAPLHNALLNAGYRVLSPQMPSTGFVYRSGVVEADIDTLVETAKTELRTGNDLIVVMFGWGGVPGAIAAERLNSWSLETPRAGHVTRLIFIAAFLLNEGECLRDILRVSSDILEVAGDRMCRMNREEGRLLFEPCAPQILPTAVSNMQHENIEIFTTRIGSPGWKYITSLYISCELDNHLSPEIQARLASRLQESNSNSAVLRLQAGHAPFLTHVPQLATLIIRAAGPS